MIIFIMCPGNGSAGGYSAFNAKFVPAYRAPRVQGWRPTITQIRWIPGGRYAVVHHRYFGLLVIEPATRKIGLLIAAKGNAFGWYDKNFSVYAGTHQRNE